MPTDVTYTFGTGARDYGDLVEWHAELVAATIDGDLVTNDENWTLEFYNDDSGGGLISAGATDISSDVTTGPGNEITLKSASGNGANGAPNDHTTRATSAIVIDDPAVGVCLDLSASFNHIFVIGAGGTCVNIENMQFRADAAGSRRGCVSISGFTGWTGYIRKSIFHVYGATGNNCCNTDGDGEISTSLLIGGSTDRTVASARGAGTFHRNNTYWISEGTGTTIEIDDTAGTPGAHMLNCAYFNMLTDFAAEDDEINASDVEVPPGTGSFQTTGDETAQFENAVNSTAGDFRLKTGNELEGQGATADIPAFSSTDIRGVAFASSPSLGCCEVASSAAAAFIHYVKGLQTLKPMEGLR